MFSLPEASPSVGVLPWRSCLGARLSGCLAAWPPGAPGSSLSLPEASPSVGVPPWLSCLGARLSGCLASWPPGVARLSLLGVRSPCWFSSFCLAAGSVRARSRVRRRCRGFGRAFGARPLLCATPLRAFRVLLGLPVAGCLGLLEALRLGQRVGGPRGQRVPRVGELHDVELRV